jgi:hypothetical protein
MFPVINIFTIRPSRSRRPMSLQSHTNSSAYEKDVQTGSACCTPEGHGQRLTRAAINCGASDIRSFVWVKADQRLSMYSVALTTSLLRESLARCSRIQLSRSGATHGALSYCRTAPRCSPPWPLIERSISKQGVDAPDSHIELARQLLNPKLLMSDQGLIIDGSGSGHREFRFGMRRAGCFGGECRLQCFNVVRNCAGFLDLKSQAIHRPTTSQTRTLVQSQSIGSYLGAMLVLLFILAEAPCQGATLLGFFAMRSGLCALHLISGRPCPVGSGLSKSKHLIPHTRHPIVGS